MSDDFLVPAGLAAEASRVAWTIVRRLADEEVIQKAVSSMAVSNEHLQVWGGPGLHGGYAGQALALRYAARVSCDAADSWSARSRDALKRAVSFTRERPFTQTGLGIGTAGFTLVLDEFAVDEPAYLPSLRRVRQSLVRQIEESPGWRSDRGVDPSHYDVVSGAAGVLGSLVGARGLDDAGRAAVGALIDDLVWMCGDADGTDSLRWYVPPGFDPRAEAAHFPHGYVDLGVAHGLAGVLAALSLAWEGGHRRPGLDVAIRKLAAYLLDKAGADEWGAVWPAWERLDAAGRPDPDGHHHGEMSWCYGAPGICSALLDAARALRDPEIMAAAVGGFESAVRRALHGDGGMLTACLCHGWAGLLMICQRFAEQGHSRVALSALTDLTERVLSLCDPDRPLVVRTLLGRDTWVDSPGFLDGAAGVPLALWSVSTPITPSWRLGCLIG